MAACTYAGSAWRRNINDNCCLAEPLKIASRLCWSAFFAKLSHEGYRNLSGPHKAVQIDKFILPVLRTRWTSWPFAKGMAQKIDALQNRLIGTLLDVHMLPAEELPEYIRRRAHLPAFSQLFKVLGLQGGLPT